MLHPKDIGVIHRYLPVLEAAALRTAFHRIDIQDTISCYSNGRATQQGDDSDIPQEWNEAFAQDDIGPDCSNILKRRADSPGMSWLLGKFWLLGPTKCLSVAPLIKNLLGVRLTLDGVRLSGKIEF